MPSIVIPPEAEPPPIRTRKEDLIAACLPFIGLIWELTQGIIAVSITGAIIYCAVWRIMSPELTNAFFLIIGFYFSRTQSSNGTKGPVPSPAQVRGK